MSSPTPRRSPFGAIESAQPPPHEGQLFERPFLTHVNLRLDPADSEALAAIQQMLGVQLPLTPNTTAASQGLLAIWLGPDEWLLLAAQDHSEALASDLQAAHDWPRRLHS